MPSPWRVGGRCCSSMWLFMCGRSARALSTDPVTQITISAALSRADRCAYCGLCAPGGGGGRRGARPDAARTDVLHLQYTAHSHRSR